MAEEYAQQEVELSKLKEAYDQLDKDSAARIHELEDQNELLNSEVLSLRQELMDKSADLEEVVLELEENSKLQGTLDGLENYSSNFNKKLDRVPSDSEIGGSPDDPPPIDFATDMELELYHRLVSERRRADQAEDKTESLLMRVEELQQEAEEFARNQEEMENLEMMNVQQVELANDTNQAIAEEIIALAARNAQLSEEIEELQYLLQEREDAMLVMNEQMEWMRGRNDTTTGALSSSENLVHDLENLQTTPRGVESMGPPMEMARDTSLSIIQKDLGLAPSMPPPQPTKPPPRANPNVPDVVKEYLNLTATVVKIKFPKVATLTSADLIKQVAKLPFFEYHDAMIRIMRQESLRISLERQTTEDKVKIKEAHENDPEYEETTYKTLAREYVAAGVRQKQLENAYRELAETLKAEQYRAKYLEEELYRAEKGIQESLSNVRTSSNALQRMSSVTNAPEQSASWAPLQRRHDISDFATSLLRYETPLRSAKAKMLFDTGSDTHDPIMREFMNQRSRVQSQLEQLKGLLHKELDQAHRNSEYFRRLVQYHEREQFAEFAALDYLYGAVHAYYLSEFSQQHFLAFLNEVDTRIQTVMPQLSQANAAQPSLPLEELFVYGVITQNCLYRMLNPIATTHHAFFSSPGPKPLYDLVESIAFESERKEDTGMEHFDLCTTSLSFDGYTDFLNAFDEILAQDDIEIIGITNGFGRQRKNEWQDVTMYVRFKEQAVKIIGQIQLCLSKFSFVKDRSEGTPEYSYFKSAAKIRQIIEKTRKTHVRTKLDDFDSEIFQTNGPLTVDDVLSSFVQLNAASISINYPEMAVDMHRLIDSSRHVAFFEVQQVMQEIVETEDFKSGGRIKGNGRARFSDDTTCATCFF